MNVPDHTTLRLGQHSICFWIRKLAEPTDWAPVVTKGFSSAENYGVWDDPASKKLKYQFQVTGAWPAVTSTTGLEVNQWYHVTCTYNGSTMVLYLNGVSNGSTAETRTPLTSTAAVRLGYAGSYNYAKAILDDVRIYNRALSAGEAAGLALQLKRRYTYGHDLISQTEASTTTYYGYDGHGSVRMLLSSASGASTTITDTYDYDAYGQLLATTD